MSSQSNLTGPTTILSPQSGLVVSLEKAKDHLRVSHSLDDDEITGFLEAAQEYVANEVLGTRQLLLQTWQLPLCGWWSGRLDLPYPPLASIQAIKYDDSAGSEQTLATSKYSVHPSAKGVGFVTTKPGVTLPAIYTLTDYPVRVEFFAGYGAGAAVPKVFHQAIKLLVGQWYSQRMAVGTVTQEVANSVQALVRSTNYGGYA